MVSNMDRIENINEKINELNNEINEHITCMNTLRKIWII